MPFSASELYAAKLKNQNLVFDPAQNAALALLDEIQHALTLNRLQRLVAFLRDPWRVQLQGLYLWGEVGRGKTLLMDIFFDSLSIKKKKRLHFYAFMQWVHQELARLKGRANPLDLLVHDLRRHTRVLCLDEFLVHDIVDAMILKNLLQALVRAGIFLVCTSNTAPANLYLKGLQRQNFIPCIQLIQSHYMIHELIAPLDYRLQKPMDDSVQLLSDPLLGPQTLDTLFKAEAQTAILYEVTQQIVGYDWQFSMLAGQQVLLSFAELCERLRNQNDYLCLCERFTAFYVRAVPVLDDAALDVALRFILLVDTLYDARAHLYLQTSVPLAKLYQGRQLSGPFQRIMSRLHEMQTAHYRRFSHKNHVRPLN